MDANLPRWLQASLNTYFKDISDGIPLPFFVEVIDEDTINVFQQDHVILRMVGPMLYEGSKGERWATLEVQILLTDIRQSSENAYNIFTWAGIFQEAMLAPIPIYRYGTGPSDDDTLLGCLQPDPGVRNHVRTVNYGQMDKELRITQMSVIARYLLYP